MQNISSPKFYVNHFPLQTLFRKPLVFDDMLQWVTDKNYTSIHGNRTHPDKIRCYEGNPSRPTLLMREKGSESMYYDNNPYLEWAQQHLIHRTTSYMYNPEVKRFFAILGHNLNAHHSSFHHAYILNKKDYEQVGGIIDFDSKMPNITAVNMGDFYAGELGCRPRADGWNICELTGLDGESSMNEYNYSHFTFTMGYPIIPLEDRNHSIGAIMEGTIFTMDNPNMEVVYSRTYEKSREYTSISGSKITQASSIAPPNWVDGLRPWQFNSRTEPFSPYGWVYGKSEYTFKGDILPLGRRRWDLSFSYIDQSKLMPRYETLINGGVLFPETTTTTGLEYISENFLIGSNDFFSMVYAPSLGGSIPFIFQPDSDADEWEPDHFCLARIADDSLQINRITKTLYDVSLTIEETF